MNPSIRFANMDGDSIAIFNADKCIGNITKTTIRGIVVGYKAKLLGYEHHAMTLESTKEWVRRSVQNNKRALSHC